MLENESFLQVFFYFISVPDCLQNNYYVVFDIKEGNITSSEKHLTI